MIHHHKPHQPEKTVAPVHNCYCQKYTSNIELSKSASYDQFVSVLSCIQTCIDDVLLWMNSSKLKLNTGKTEVGCWLCILSSVGQQCANIGGNGVTLKTSVKYLGVHLNRRLSVQQHISSICCVSFLELWCVTSIWPYLWCVCIWLVECRPMHMIRGGGESRQEKVGQGGWEDRLSLVVLLLKVSTIY